MVLPQTEPGPQPWPILETVGPPRLSKTMGVIYTILELQSIKSHFKNKLQNFIDSRVPSTSPDANSKGHSPTLGLSIDPNEHNRDAPEVLLYTGNALAHAPTVTFLNFRTFWWYLGLFEFRLRRL